MKMAEQMGWNNYGDKQYVPHVLRYYPIGKVFYTPEGGNAHLLRLGPTGRCAGPCWDCGEGGEWDGGKLTIPAPAIC